MKKRLVTYILISAMAAAVFAGCSKKDGGDAAANGDAAVTEATGEEAVVTEQTTQDAVTEAVGTESTAVGAETVAAEDIAAIEAADAAETETASTGEAAVEEYVDDEEKEEGEATEKPAAEEEVLVVDPGTQYTVRFGGNVYSSPEENAANVMYYANPGDTLNIVERLDNYWYKVSYWIAGEGVEHVGYIQIQ